MAISFFLVCILAAIVASSAEKQLVSSDAGSHHEGIVLRADDTYNTLTVVEAQHSAAISDLYAKYTAMQADHAAMKADFAAMESKMASMSTPLVYTAEAGAAKHYQAGDIVHFDRVITDVGGLYDRFSGIITVPQGGSYLVSVRSDPPPDQNANEKLELKLNNQHVIYAYAEHGTTNSITVVLRLAARDRLWLTQYSDGTLEYAATLSVVRISV